MAKSERPPFYQQVADKLIEQLKDGTAPWLKPWKPGEHLMPHNPVSGSRYKGANAVWLSMVSTDKGYGDPRWMTYKQAAGIGAQVRKGEKGTPVQYWKFRDQVPKLDDKGAPVLDEAGKPVKVTVELQRPKVFSAVVFNAQQIDGVPELEPKTVSWDPHARAEAILAASGVPLHHDQADRAFYRPKTDEIHMPGRDQFDTADRYYATALHELGHATGHSSRLDRDLSNPFGSEGYAKEELRAEIASMMLGDELGIGHDPGQHVAYVASWIKALQEDPSEILRASRDAEKIMEYTLGLEQTQEKRLERDTPTPTQEADIQPEGEKEPMIATERTYLAVPYADKEDAKRLAGKLANGHSAIAWDKAAKSWYAKPGADLSKLGKWRQDGPAAAVALENDPRAEFAQALAAAGLVLKGAPAMDGQMHRVPAEGDQGPERSGAYVGYLDGRPAGFIQNHRTGLKENWKSQNASAQLSAEEKAALQADAARKREEREAARDKQYEHHARRCGQLHSLLPDAKDDHPYLVKKGIPAFPGMKVDKKGRLVVPLRDEKGKIWSLQRITGNGFKSLKKFAKKVGNYFVVGDEKQLGKTAGPVISAEGVATAGTLAQATGKPVVVAFDSGNLPVVAEKMAELYPNSLQVIAGDDDRQKEPSKNVGRIKALHAAEKTKGVAAFPVFTRTGGTDWNDLQQQHGIGAVRLQIDAVLSNVEKVRLHWRKPEPKQEVKVEQQQHKMAKRVGIGR